MGTNRSHIRPVALTAVVVALIATLLTLAGGKDASATDREEVSGTIPIPQISIGDASASEADGVAVARVSLSAVANRDVLVNVHTSARSATGQGVDYRGFYRTITVAAGETTADVSVTLIDDGLVEDPETLTLMLTNPRNATIDDPLATVTILDNDGDEPGDPDLGPGLSVTDFNAVCDGQTDDTAAIQAVIDRARIDKIGVIFPADRTCSVNSLKVANGVTYLAGGTLLFSAPGTANVGVMLMGIERGEPDNVKDLLITDTTFDLAGRQGWGIRAENSSRVTIDGITVLNRPANANAVIFVARDAGGEDMIGNVVRNSTFTGEARSGGSITFKGSTPGGFPSSGPGSYWQLFKEVRDSQFRVIDTKIIDNNIDGGYYGIGFTFAEGTIIEGNTSTNNIRNISLQQQTTRSVVRDNTLFNSVSASIHLAQAANDNLVENNRIDTELSRGEGLIQAYVGSKRNIIRNNAITARPSPTAPFAPKWHLYAAAHADDNVFENNSLSGVAAYSFIGIETGYDSTIDNFRHRGRTAGPRVNNYADEDMRGVRVVGNTIDPENDTPPILITEIEDDAGQLALVDLTIKDNTVVGRAGYCVETILDGSFSTHDLDLDGWVDTCTIG